LTQGSQSGRKVFLDLARSGLRMPIGADLTLHDEPDAEAVKYDGARLGAVVERTARLYGTPLAVPLMDLTLEKLDLLSFLSIPEQQIDGWHFDEEPPQQVIDDMAAGSARPFPARIQAHQDAIRHVARHGDLYPIGMIIGPFSLATKLVRDPIAAVAMAGAGVTAADDAGVRLIERCLALAESTVQRSARAQIAAGARAILVCEPAANAVYISPRQMRAGSDIFDRFVLGPNRRLNAAIAALGADLVFHDCGELTTRMVGEFANELHPVMLSLGSSRKLWEDAAVVPHDVVLFGNLPSRMFYSDAVMPVEEVERRTLELISKMRACDHPHIVGSECDVLYVPDAAATIRRKVDVMVTCGLA
jgi:uroporphyrinogen-III decarboxylase